MRAYEFVDWLIENYRPEGTAHKELVFLTEDGGYVPIDITFEDDHWYVLLLEEGK